MEPINYLIVIIIFIAVYYLFKKTKKPVIKKPIEEGPYDFLGYPTEIEPQFSLRCYYFIVEWLNQNRIAFECTSDLKLFAIKFDHPNGDSFNYYIESSFSENKKIMMFYGDIITQTIPDNKLNDISEFVNRLNERLLIGSLYLDYENRTVTNKLVYYVGNTQLQTEKVGFYYGMLLGVQINTSIKQIINSNDNPALVALDWSN